MIGIFIDTNDRLIVCTYCTNEPFNKHKNIKFGRVFLKNKGLIWSDNKIDNGECKFDEFRSAVT